MTFNFVKFVPDPDRTWLSKMKVGEVCRIRGKSNAKRMIKKIMDKFPERVYVWDHSVNPIAVRRDK